MEATSHSRPSTSLMLPPHTSPRQCELALFEVKVHSVWDAKMDCVRCPAVVLPLASPPRRCNISEQTASFSQPLPGLGGNLGPHRPLCDLAGQIWPKLSGGEIGVGAGRCMAVEGGLGVNVWLGGWGRGLTGTGISGQEIRKLAAGTGAFSCTGNPVLQKQGPWDFLAENRDKRKWDCS